MPKVQVHAASKKNMKSRQKSSKKTGKKTGGVVNLNESAMYSASVIKPFVMASTFDQIKKGNLKYNSTVKDKYTKTGCHHTLHPASSASVGDGQSNITSVKDCGILLNIFTTEPVYYQNTQKRCGSSCLLRQEDGRYRQAFHPESKLQTKQVKLPVLSMIWQSYMERKKIT